MLLWPGPKSPAPAKTWTSARSARPDPSFAATPRTGTVAARRSVFAARGLRIVRAGWSNLRRYAAPEQPGWGRLRRQHAAVCGDGGSRDDVRGRLDGEVAAGPVEVFSIRQPFRGRSTRASQAVRRLVGPHAAGSHDRDARESRLGNSSRAKCLPAVGRDGAAECTLKSPTETRKARRFVRSCGSFLCTKGRYRRACLFPRPAGSSLREASLRAFRDGCARSLVESVSTSTAGPRNHFALTGLHGTIDCKVGVREGLSPGYVQCFLWLLGEPLQPQPRSFVLLPERTA